VGFPVGAQGRDEAVLVDGVDEDAVDGHGGAVAHGGGDGGDVGAAVAVGEGVGDGEPEAFDGGDELVPEGADAVVAAVTVAGRVEEGRADGVLDEGVGGEQLQPGVLVAADDGRHGGAGGAAGGMVGVGRVPGDGVHGSYCNLFSFRRPWR